jgi:hypothetical protein
MVLRSAWELAPLTRFSATLRLRCPNARTAQYPPELLEFVEALPDSEHRLTIHCRDYHQVRHCTVKLRVQLIRNGLVALVTVRAIGGSAVQLLAGNQP